MEKSNMKIKRRRAKKDWHYRKSAKKEDPYTVAKAKWRTGPAPWPEPKHINE